MMKLYHDTKSASRSRPRVKIDDRYDAARAIARWENEGGAPKRLSARGPSSRPAPAPARAKQSSSRYFIHHRGSPIPDARRT
jgi:hypothetical protein